MLLFSLNQLFWTRQNQKLALTRADVLTHQCCIPLRCCLQAHYPKPKLLGIRYLHSAYQQEKGKGKKEIKNNLQARNLIRRKTSSPEAFVSFSSCKMHTNPLSLPAAQDCHYSTSTTCQE